MDVASSRYVTGCQTLRDDVAVQRRKPLFRDGVMTSPPGFIYTGRVVGYTSVQVSWRATHGASSAKQASNGVTDLCDK